MTLEDWLRKGLLRTHRSSRQEIAELFAISDRDLANCRTPGLDAEWRLAIAYNAALQAATAALAAAGRFPTRRPRRCGPWRSACERRLANGFRPHIRNLHRATQKRERSSHG